VSWSVVDCMLTRARWNVWCSDTAKYRQEERGLRISKLDLRDNGTYDCRAEVASHGNLRVRQITVDVLCKVYFVVFYDFDRYRVCYDTARLHRWEVFFRRKLAYNKQLFWVIILIALGLWFVLQGKPPSYTQSYMQAHAVNRLFQQKQKQR